MSIEDKPIALITGAPGSGKTALIVHYIKQAADKGRPIFQVGIPELQIPHIPPPKSMDDWTELREDPDMEGKMLPYFTFPENSLIVLSEAQRLYRPRPSASKLPDYVAAFETCRHTGVTFILDTQHPDFLDGHIRKLIGQHIHLIDHGVLGRKHYEWPYLGNPEQFKSAPIKKPYKLPTSVYGLYKSSSLHVKRNYTFPPALKLLIVLALAISVGGYFIFGRLQDKFSPSAGVAALDPKSKTAQPSASPASGQSPDPASLLLEFSPLVPGRPETAPAYNGLRVVKNMPVVVGCIKTARACACINQQGLDAGLDQTQCNRWLDSPPFDAYRDAPQPVASVPGLPSGQPANLPAGQMANSPPSSPNFSALPAFPGMMGAGSSVTPTASSPQAAAARPVVPQDSLYRFKG